MARCGRAGINVGNYLRVPANAYIIGHWSVPPSPPVVNARASVFVGPERHQQAHFVAIPSFLKNIRYNFTTQHSITPNDHARTAGQPIKIGNVQLPADCERLRLPPETTELCFSLSIPLFCSLFYSCLWTSAPAARSSRKLASSDLTDLSTLTDWVVN